jgi:hypothetical protein
MGGTVNKSKALTNTDLTTFLKGDQKTLNDLKTKQGYLTSDAMTSIVERYKLKKGDTFTYDNETYVVTVGEDAIALQAKAVRRALGGPVVAGQTYAINDRINSLGYQQEGFSPFTPQMSGMIYPNASTMPRYNIASGNVTGMRGGMNSSSSNNNYSINIELNGTNVTADDVVRRFKQELALVNAKEGRQKNVGGAI